MAEVFDKLCIPQPVLDGNFCGGMSGLPAADAVGFQHNGLNAAFLQYIRSQAAG